MDCRLNKISPKRCRRRLATELVEPEPSEDGNEDGNQMEDDISFMEENSVEFVQELADGLKGDDEDPGQFTEGQKDVVVTDQFSGCLMPFRAVLLQDKDISIIVQRAEGAVAGRQPSGDFERSANETTSRFIA